MVVYAVDKIEVREQAYILLKRGARELWGLTPFPNMTRTLHGKPYFPDHPECHFNLSHSQPYALCALDDAPVGADIQRIREDLLPRLPGRVCSPREIIWLVEQPDRWRAFALLWALKEARAKYDGTGLSTGIRDISIPLPQPGQSLYAHDGLWFRTYEGDHWMAAVCGEHEPPEALLWVE